MFAILFESTCSSGRNPSTLLVWESIVFLAIMRELFEYYFVHQIIRKSSNDESKLHPCRAQCWRAESIFLINFYRPLWFFQVVLQTIAYHQLHRLFKIFTPSSLENNDSQFQTTKQMIAQNEKYYAAGKLARIIVLQSLKLSWNNYRFRSLWAYRKNERLDSSKFCSHLHQAFLAIESRCWTMFLDFCDKDLCMYT